jgi:CMP-N,N'-diacetyllegionaminic acid synthase
MKSICFIAARKGSKGVPKKNIRQIGGKPLIAHSILAALETGIFDTVIVSTEDKEIAKIAKKFGAEVPFIRPKYLATDTASGEEVLLHGIKKLYSKGYDFDTVQLRDCTCPFIRKKDIIGSVNVLQKTQADCVMTVYKTHHNPYVNLLEKNNSGNLKVSKKYLQKIQNRQDAPTVYQLIGLFTINARKMVKYETWNMPKTIPYEIPIETGLMIDTEYEFKIAELIFKNKRKFGIE